jgi:hypothetical protein
MFRLIPVSALVVTCCLAAGCAEEAAPTTPEETPVQIDETFEGTITVNGAATHIFTTERAGQASANLLTLTPEGAIVSFVFGPFNGQYCQATIFKDDAAVGQTLVGNATAGSFCVRIADVGRLTGPATYSIKVSHF